MFAADLDIDVGGAIGAASTKPFGFMRFEPGPGVGGPACPSTRRIWPGGRGRLGRPFRFVSSPTT